MTVISMQLRYLIFSSLNSRKRDLHAACYWYLSHVLTSRISMISWRSSVFCSIRSHLFACSVNWLSIFYIIEILTVSYFQTSASDQHDIIFVWLREVLEIVRQSSYITCSENKSSKSFNMLIFSHRRRLISDTVLMSSWQS